jgi:peptide/nickel transport system substrate-binding protein
MYPIRRRAFLVLALGAAALPLAQACSQPPAASKPDAQKPATEAKPPAPAATVVPQPPAPAPTVAAKPATDAKPAAEAKPAEKPAAEAVKRGGQLVQSINWTYPTMDPHLTSISYLVGTGPGALYNNLVRLELVDPKTWEHKVVGDLAESWEQPDPQTLVFKLKQGVKFHDGSDLTSDVVAWNYLRARDHEKSQRKSQLTALDAIETPDKLTVRMKLKGPNAAFLRNIAYVAGGGSPIISKAAWEKGGDDQATRQPVGTGPFKFKQWITDDRIVLEKNPDYFEKGADGKPLPYLDEFVGRFVPDPSVALVDLQAGSLHLLEWVLTKDVTTIKANQNLLLDELPWAGQVYFMVGYNTEAPPFDDVRVRQAASMAIDRDGMSKALGFGVGAPHFYPDWAVGSLGYDDKIVKNEYNPAKAKELLAAAGHPNGVSIELKVIAREPENTIGEFAQQMWSRSGFQTKLVSMERLAWIDEVRAKKFQACFWRGSLITSVDPDALGVRIKTGGTANWAQFSDKEIDRLMDQGAETLDPAKRHEIYRQVLTIIQEKAYLATGISMPLMMARRKEVMGITYNHQMPNLDRVWLNK